MTKLIIGGGYLGMRVARLWKAQSERVYITSRRAERCAELASEGYEPVLFDVLGPDSSALPEVDTVVHCVGYDRTAGIPMQRVYVEGLGNVLSSLRNRPRFIHVSSTSVYGQTGGEEVDESSPTEPTEESGRIVLDAERLLRQARPDAVVLRFGGIYGPGRLLRRVESLRSSEPIAADPDGWLNLIHVEDGAAAVVAAVSAASGQTYNIVDDSPMRRGDFYSFLAKLLDAPPPQYSVCKSSSNRRIRNTRMRRELGIVLRYPTFREGLVEAIKPA